MRRTLSTACAATMLLIGLHAQAAAAAGRTVVYDDFDKPGYGPVDYALKWANSYGPGELAAGGSQSFNGGRETVVARPFKTSVDTSVFDHIKYFAVAKKPFAVPKHGSITFRSTMSASTRGIVPGKIITGTYTQSGAPYSATLLNTQQAGVVMNVVDFCTGQLFDWFLTSTRAAPLIERLPTNVTQNTTNPDCPGATPVGRELMYTQYIKEVRVRPGVAHRVEITFAREPHGQSSVEYRLDGRRIARVRNVGVPLDKQGVKYTGTYPSLGPGERLASKLNSFSLGHGLFSVVDAFPFQHPEAPELAVSIPPALRIFGQGARGSWDDFRVTTRRKG
ncbi:MAG: hypothetical protein QOI73_3294 [Solirubrobacteraceae bacterium]|nr:hypothetical protein [Solirubrobacteraceae bacterium]